MYKPHLLSVKNSIYFATINKILSIYEIDKMNNHTLVLGSTNKINSNEENEDRIVRIHCSSN